MRTELADAAGLQPAVVVAVEDAIVDPAVVAIRRTRLNKRCRR
jgi:hypothetical protein